MEEKQSFLKEYFATVAFTFTGTALGVSLSGWAVGRIFPDEWNNDLSQSFLMMDGGLSFATIAQLFAMSLLIAVWAVVFYSDRFLKKTMLLWRYAITVLLCIATLSVFALVFGWFPAGVWQAWAAMVAAFLLSFTLSVIPMIVKTKKEDKRLEQQLLEYKSKRARDEAINNE